MRYLGIDYGSKRVGLALSDEEGTMAFPYVVLENKSDLLERMKAIIEKEKVEKIVIGESKNFQGEENKIMLEIKKFADDLKGVVGKEVFYEPEFLSSHQAVQIQGKNSELDASAAAIILQSFLDRG
jgi:putative Holliday junction resolvase